jgi:WD40 repeat protein
VGIDGKPGPLLKAPKGVDATFAVAWSPDGNWLASAGSGDAPVRLWDRDGKAVSKFEGHEGGSLAVAWSPDGIRLASGGSDDRTVRMWNRDGTPGPVLKGHEGSVLSVAWCPDGRRLASSGDWTVWLWNEDGKPGPVLKAHQGEVWSVAWSRDGKRLASGSRDGTVRIHDADGEPICTIVVLPNDQSAIFSAAGELLHGDPKVIETEFVYIVENEDGRIEPLKPSEFRKRFPEAYRSAWSPAVPARRVAE